MQKESMACRPWQQMDWQMSSSGNDIKTISEKTAANFLLKAIIPKFLHSRCIDKWGLGKMTKPLQNTLDFLIESIQAKLYKKVRFWENAPNYFKKSAAKTILKASRPNFTKNGRFWKFAPNYFKKSAAKFFLKASRPNFTKKWKVLKICTKLL